MDDYLYVLHAFQKKSPKGIKTAKTYINLIEKCYQKEVEIKEKNGITL